MLQGYLYVYNYTYMYNTIESYLYPVLLLSIYMYINE